MLIHLMTQFAGGRRHQLIQESQDDDKHYLIEQLSKFIEEQARMRFQQQIHQHHQQKQQGAPQEITGPGFSFVIPPMTKADFNKESNVPIQFAVKPFDSRYYENTETEDGTEDFEENSNVVNDLQKHETDSKSNILIPPPMHVHESGKILHRGQLKQAKVAPAADVVQQKPLQVEFDNTTSLYIVALIAGLSCAFSTGVSCDSILPIDVV